MIKINKQYRKVESTTDVLSFPQISDFGLSMEDRISDSPFVLGDIVINLHRAQRQANEYNLGLYEELKRILIHGLLHLIHYDHETSHYQKKKMKAKEKELLKALRLL